MMEGEEDEEREIWCSKIDWKGGGAGGGCWYIYGASCNPVRLIAVQGYLLIACFAPMHFVVYV